MTPYRVNAYKAVQATTPVLEEVSELILQGKLDEAGRKLQVASDALQVLADDLQVKAHVLD